MSSRVTASLLTQVPMNSLNAAVDIYLTGYRDSSSGQTAVNIARNEAELCLECRPAFARQMQRICGSLCVPLPSQAASARTGPALARTSGFLLPSPSSCFHILYHIRNSRIACMLVEGLEQIQLRVLFNLHAQVVQLLDRCVACQEVQRTRAKADDLQIRQTNDSACDRQQTHESYLHILQRFPPDTPEYMP